MFTYNKCIHTLDLHTVLKPQTKLRIQKLSSLQILEPKLP